MHSDRLDERTAFSATVVIVTRNRREDVLRAVASAVRQEFEPLEVLVYDDASEDETADAVRREFPSVRVVRAEERVGYIVLRNRGFREANGDVVFSIDDDAYFTCARTVSRIMAEFKAHPKIAAVALPYIEPSAAPSGRMRQCLTDRRLRGFVGCSHALRRSAALELGGYREFFVHQGEERDLAIRLRHSGYEIVYRHAPPIVHTVSPRRDHRVMSYYGVRNTLLFDVLNIPLPYVVGRLAMDAFNLLRYKLTFGTLLRRLGYIFGSLGACAKFLSLRAPVSRRCYREFRSLPGHGPIAWDGPMEDLLPAGDIGEKILSNATST